MSQTISMRDLVAEVGSAIRRPEAVALKWRGEPAHGFTTLILLFLLNAALGLAVYGLTMQLHQDASAMLRAAFLAPLAAGSAWLIALPALYIFNSALGSRMTLGSTILAASITVCFGSWAMLASVPINWFFSLAVPVSAVRLLVNIVIFTGVGICMTDVFLRILKALEPDRSTAFGVAWIGLIAVIGMELFSLFGIFQF